MNIQKRMTHHAMHETLPHGQKGFSYIEALIAAALLSIMLVPVLSGFLQSNKNFQFAMDAYRADLLAKSLLLDSRKAVRLGRQGGADSFEAWIDGFNDIYDRDSFDYAVFVQPIDDPDGGFALSTHGGSIAAPVFSGNVDLLRVQETAAVGYDATLLYDDGLIPQTGSIAEAMGDRVRLLYVRDSRVRLEVARCERDLTVDIHNPYSHAAVLDIHLDESVTPGHIKLRNNGYAGTIVRFFEKKQPNRAESASDLFMIAVEVLSKDGRLLRRLEGI